MESPQVVLELQPAGELPLLAEAHWQRAAPLVAVPLVLSAESLPPPEGVARRPTRA